MEKLILIDGNSLINRAFYANPPMTTKNGTPTGAIFGFVNMLIKIIHDINPTHITVAFDVKAPTFRHQMYSDYKGTRKPMPDDLRPQIPLLKQVLSAMGIHIEEQAGIEADDIIGTIAKATSMDTYIITGDKDSFQLVDDETTVYFTKRGITDIDIYNIDNFKEKTSILPHQIIDLKAFMGDSSDNIPGIPGVGEKTALTLLQKYGSVENLYENTDELTGKLKEKVILGKESCFLSKKLATINTACDIDVNVDHMKFSFPFPYALKKQFIELEFKTFIKKDDLFSQEIIDEEITTPNVNKITVNNLSEVDGLFNEDKLSFVFSNNLYLSNGINEYVIKLKDNFFDDGFMFEEILPVIKKVFNRNGITIVYDKKSTYHTFKNYTLDYTSKIEDVSIIKYLADYTGKNENLEDIIDEYQQNKDTPAFSLFSIYTELKNKLDEEKLSSLYYDIELPLSDVLYDMEVSGFKIDLPTLHELNKKFTTELTQLENKIYDLSGTKFNLKSPKQLGDILFDKLGLKHSKKNKKGYSTNAEVLESLENEHEIIPYILKYRQLSKLISTYIEGFIPLVDKNTGLIHTSFNQVVTSTGRLSSKEPNLQNIPIRDDIGKEIRKFFVPRDNNHILIGADYSQIELRLLAHFSKCEKLINAYIKEADIHTITASEVFNVPVSEVTKDMRRNAKAVNFGIIYGISEFGLAKNIKTSNYLAREYIKTYFEKYPEVKEYMNANVQFAKENGFVSTLLGRKRYIRELSSSNFNVRSFGERAAMNMPLQGSSADIIKIAMVNVYNRLKKENLKSKLILQVHDELIIDALKDEQDQVLKLLVDEMENAVSLSVPLTVDTEIGETWFDAK